jgi:hypothetical protein
LPVVESPTSDYFSSESEESHSPATQIANESDDDFSPEKGTVAELNLHTTTTAKKNLKFNCKSNAAEDDLASAQLNLLILQRLRIELQAAFESGQLASADKNKQMFEFTNRVVQTQTIPTYISVAQDDELAKARIITFATEYMWTFKRPKLKFDFKATKQNNGTPLKKC